MEAINVNIQKILADMTVKEKALALTGESMFKLGGRKDIPATYFLDGGTGAAYHQMFIDCFYRVYRTDKNAAEELINDVSSMADKMLRLRNLVLDVQNDPTPQETEEVEVFRKAMTEYVPNDELPGCFPPGIVLGASWDPESIYAMGQAVGAEADYYKIDVLLGTPNVNIHRDPLGGRLFEGYSEDPCLVAKLAPWFVKGVQSQGIAANAKHFAANNQETDRRTVNEHIPVRALHEIYFPGFKACVQEGGCKTVMSAYNAINGEYCSQNHWLMTEVLRNKWGFEGFVVSDWSAVYDQVAALKAGNDVDMPGPRNVDAIVSSVEHGELDEKILDNALKRVWTTILSLPCCTQGHKTKAIDREGSRKAAYNSVAEGMVLLKNRNQTLPLSATASVSVYGEKSKKLIECGGGSANIITDQTSNIFDCVTKLVGQKNVQDGEVTQQTDAVIVTVGSGGQEGFDRKSLEIDAQDKSALQKAIDAAKQYGKPVVVILNTCGPVDITRWLEDIDALLCIFIPGMEGGHACADALFGTINPSGKLPLTFPKQYKDCPTSTSFPGWNEESWYGEDIFVGYRYYDYRNVDPLYPFGYGLSYTTFVLTDASLSDNMLQIDNGCVTLSVKVKNTGKTAGKEVVQVYIGQENPTLVKPTKELKHFQKVALQPGEEKIVTFRLKKDDFASYDTSFDDWTVEPGCYQIYVGNSSRSIGYKLNLKVKGFDPYGINEKTQMGVIAATPGALDTLCQFCPEGGRITKEAIEASILYQPMGNLRDYWKNRIESEMPGSPSEKEKIYRQMLLAINQFK